MKQKKKFISWIKEHVVWSWAIISIIFALIIHILFLFEAPWKWLVADWESGDILAYVGTISLGLLTLWQNKQFKKENDLSQERLEKLTIQANELAVVNKIIEFETSNLSRLKKAFDDFSVNCDPHVLANVYSVAIESKNATVAIRSAMVEAEKKLEDSYCALSRELRIDSQMYSGKEKSLIDSIKGYYKASEDYIKHVMTYPSQDYASGILVIQERRNKFVVQRERYLIQRERMLNSVIYGNLTLDEIKKLYQNIR